MKIHQIKAYTVFISSPSWSRSSLFLKQSSSWSRLNTAAALRLPKCTIFSNSHSCVDHPQPPPPPPSQHTLPPPNTHNPPQAGPSPHPALPQIHPPSQPATAIALRTSCSKAQDQFLEIYWINVTAAKIQTAAKRSCNITQWGLMWTIKHTHTLTRKQSTWPWPWALYLCWRNIMVKTK